MIQYTAKNMKIDGTNITLDVDGKGILTADMSGWEDLIRNVGGAENIKKAKQLIVAGIIGLIIILTAYAIANFVVGSVLNATT